MLWTLHSILSRLSEVRIVWQTISEDAVDNPLYNQSENSITKAEASNGIHIEQYTYTEIEG